MTMAMLLALLIEYSVAEARRDSFSKSEQVSEGLLKAQGVSCHVTCRVPWFRGKVDGECTLSRLVGRKPMPTSGQNRKRTAALFVGLLLSLVYTSAAMQPPIELDSSEDGIESHELQRQLDALQIKHDTMQHKHGALQHKYDALLHELPRWMKRKIRSKEETTEVAYQVCSASAASCEDWPQPSPNREHPSLSCLPSR